ncbi:MAG: 8-oxo-dGTP diphosphatase MutT [Proteobacteria bacterium]|nr:8-oxo-dGTP diphosphatase MutT [Pseudomonadota bacterium]
MKVAVAVIFNEIQEILITKRPLSTSQGGKWEFPGGKLESGEEATIALIREIKEEINLDILNSAYLGVVNYEYEDKKVELIVFTVNQFSGEPRCLEGQLDMRWVPLSELRNFEFPRANKQIIDLIEYYCLCKS